MFDVQERRLYWVVFFTMFFAGIGHSVPVEFEDEPLKSLVAAKLGVETPSETDMLRLEELSVPWGTIRSLQGLEAARNLVRLDIENNSIVSLEPIRNLKKLKQLDVSGCGLRSLESLANLNDLEILEASRNALDQTAFLKNHPWLQKLDLSDNGLSDITHLSTLLKLESLHLDNNQIRDISVLAGLNGLKTLSCFGNRLQDFNGIRHLEGLEMLQLGCNAIADIAVLSQLKHLRYLGLTDNRISDISPLFELKNLELLELGENRIVDVSCMTDLLELKYLALQNNNISDITSLYTLKQIEMLNLNGNPLNEGSVELMLPLLFLRDPDRVNIYFAEKRYETDDRELRELPPLEYLIGPDAAISPDGKYLAIVIGPRHRIGLEIPDEAARVYIFDLAGPGGALIPVPGTMGVGFDLGRYSMAWRCGTSGSELFVSIDWYASSLEPPMLKGFALLPDGQVKQVYSRYFWNKNLSGVERLQWLADGTVLSGQYCGQLVLLNDAEGPLRRFNVRGEEFAWDGQDVLYAATGSGLVRVEIPVSGGAQPKPYAAANCETCLGGITDHKPIYSFGSEIFVGSKLIYAAKGEIQQLYAGDSEIVFHQGDSVCVIDFQGSLIYSKALQTRTRILAFAPDGKYFYVLEDNRTIQKWSTSDPHDSAVIYGLQRQGGSAGETLPVRLQADDGRDGFVVAGVMEGARTEL